MTNTTHTATYSHTNETPTAGRQTPISAGFVPDPNGFYTAHSVANFLGCSETAARAYFRTLQIPSIIGMGYIGSDIIAATVDLRAGRLRREPLSRSRPPVPKSDTPKYAAANGRAAEAQTHHAQTKSHLQAIRVEKTMRKTYYTPE